MREFEHRAERGGGLGDLNGFLANSSSKKSGVPLGQSWNI